MTPERLKEIQRKYPSLYAEYKVRRLNEMACYWSNKPHQPHTIPLLAMLIQESGSLDPLIRGDWKGGGYYAIGISQHHICHRRTFGKRYCYWQDGKHPQQQVEEAYPQFTTDWRSQFFHYSDVIRSYIDEGMTTDKMIWRWNPGERNRRWRVGRWEGFVSLSIKP